jgi:hypothetical protein
VVTERFLGMGFSVGPRNQCSLGGGGLLEFILSLAGGGRDSLAGNDVRGRFDLVTTGVLRVLVGSLTRTVSLRGAVAFGRSGWTTTVAFGRSGRGMLGVTGRRVRLAYSALFLSESRILASDQPDLIMRLL